MAPHTINTTVADRQLGKCYFYKNRQNIIINANTNKYWQNQTILL